MCYDNAYIDFTQFSSALIVGKKEHNDDVSNGVGKTTMFKAIEYCLFNHADIKLEDIIRDDTDICSVTVDFIVDNQEYRITRKRTRKGATDVTLYKRTALDGEDEEALYSIINDGYIPLSDEMYWKDTSGRRAGDTEKEICKLLKINVKSFRIFVHFVQGDFSGLTTATPEKRKAILRDALNLAIYPKLEKIAKEQASVINKEITKLNTLLEAIGNPENELSDLEKKLIEIDQDIDNKSSKMTDLDELRTQITEKINLLTNDHSNLEGKFSALLVKEKTLKADQSKIETLIKEFATKKANIIKVAEEIVNQVKGLEATQLELIKIDFNQIGVLSEQIVQNKEKIAQNNLTIKNDTVRCEKLKRPIPVGGECENCRQVITEEHRKICQQKIDEELKERLVNIQNCAKATGALNAQNIDFQQKINTIAESKKRLENINIEIIAKKKEIVDKRSFHDEFQNSLKKYTQELLDKNKELEQISIDIDNSSLKEANVIQEQIKQEKQNLIINSNQIAALNKEIVLLSNNKAVTQHNIKRRKDDKTKKTGYIKNRMDLEKQLETYPLVIEAFSSSGIPNLIIQNVLDDLQVEANDLLAQLKPGLQLSFSIEKTVEKTGDQADTLDINYTVNGKKRYYENLSGAMKLAVTFSLKLGLSFLLQKMMGVNIQFLLLDEIDPSLDKSSVDAFADIVKFFQKDFTILVITHNDRLKDKFKNYILVEQDINMVSKARVVSSW
jgi:DNA repair exonuclease SbcCD ATPase subunit